MSSQVIRLSVILVLYNRRLSTLPFILSDQWTSLRRCFSWVVIDNSEIETPGARDFARANGITYVWMGGNAGLAVAYNRGLGEVESNTEFVCFLDQDTDGVGEFLRVASRRLSDSSADILMPVVRTGTMILSPCRRVGPWYGPIRREGTLPKRFSCINTGMIARRRVFESTRFEKDLFLDYVDHQFVRDATAAGFSFAPLWDCQLLQDYSRDSDSQAQATRRFRIFQRDVKRFYASSRVGRAWAVALLANRVLVATARYRTTQFVRAFLFGDAA